MFALGCAQGTKEKSSFKVEPAAPNTPVFTLAWSEYPSWSVFGVLGELGAIAPEKGKVGVFEKKHNVDLVLAEADYDPCITGYGTGSYDAVCVTNIDALNPSRSKKSVVTLFNSTSAGGDALVVTDAVKTIEDLFGKDIRGLDLSVAPYCLYRNFEIRGLDPNKIKFTQNDPGAAAQAMQQGQAGYDAIQVWNPYKRQTLKTTPKARVLTDKDGKPFDSSMIPGEIIDAVVFSQDALKREGGTRAADCINEAYYHFSGMLNDKSQKDALLVALGAKFSTMNAEDMSLCLVDTKLYSTATEGSTLVKSDEFKKVMEKIVPWCKAHHYFDSPAAVETPTIAWGDWKTSEANLTFDSSFMENAK